VVNRTAAQQYRTAESLFCGEQSTAVQDQCS
jgi:hypothetical protein